MKVSQCLLDGTRDCLSSHYLSPGSATLLNAEDEDDLQTRIERKRESAEAARIKAAEQIIKDSNERLQDLEVRLAESKVDESAV